MIDEKSILASINDGFDGRLDKGTFMYALKWFKENIWHEPIEQPIEDKFILTKFMDSGKTKYEIDNVSWLADSFGETWLTHCRDNEIRAWCYIEDLLPK